MARVVILFAMYVYDTSRHHHDIAHSRQSKDHPSTLPTT